jgi:single-strand selective monofunctional uracil DNA glycosylase
LARSSPDGAARARRVRAASTKLRRNVDALSFGAPVSHVYNPLDYAVRGWNAYVDAFATNRKRVIFLGMNPGPFGMSQTGVPFGDVGMVRDFLGIEARIGRPDREHPKRPIQGFDCTRSEVSGSRLWGAIHQHWGTAARFFRHHFIANYCPLVFLEAGGRNRTPDKLPANEREPLFATCDAHLLDLVRIFEPEWVIGIGAFAEKRAAEALHGSDIRIARILHPSPASPLANRGWSPAVTRELRELGLCTTR